MTAATDDHPHGNADLECGARGRVFEDDIRYLASFERGSASKGERLAAEHIGRRLGELGCQEVSVEVERAHGSYWWPLGLLNAAVAVVGARALARAVNRPSRDRRVSRRSRLACAAIGASAAGAIWDDVSGGHLWFRRALPQRDTYNVVAHAGDLGAKRTVVFIAHHDAAHSGLVFHPALPRLLAERLPGLHERSSRSFPVMYLVWLGSVLVALGGMTGSRRLLAWGCTFAAGSVAAMTDIAMRGVVPGANDNLSAVAVLLDLARSLREQPADEVRVILLSTGSEESFMEGMHGFARRHFPALNSDSAEFVCLECLGGPTLTLVEGEGMLRMRDYPEAMRTALIAAAARAGVTLNRGLRTVAATDGLIALRAGYPTGQLASVDHTKFPTNYHWPTDTPENLTWRTIGEAAAICEEFLRGRTAPESHA